MYINSLYFTEILSIARIGFAKSEILNIINRIIYLTLHKPIKAARFPNYHKKNFEFFQLVKYLQNYIIKNVETLVK